MILGSLAVFLTRRHLTGSRMLDEAGFSLSILGVLHIVGEGRRLERETAIWHTAGTYHWLRRPLAGTQT